MPAVLEYNTCHMHCGIADRSNIHNTMQRDLYETMWNEEYDTLGTLNTERMFRVRYY